MMRSLMHRAVVTTGAAVVVLGPAVWAASPAGADTCGPPALARHGRPIPLAAEQTSGISENGLCVTLPMTRRAGAGSGRPSRAQPG